MIVDDKRESLQEEVKSPALYSKACLIGEEIGSSYAWLADFCLLLSRKICKGKEERNLRVKNKLHKMIILLAVYLVSSPIPVRDETEKK